MPVPSPIPILLLKTQSLPHDTYLDHFSSSPDTKIESEPRPRYHPVFVPVLEHTQNEDALSKLEELLQNGRLKEKYGGMIFTSQRAVEAWASVVEKVDESNAKMERGLIRSSSPDYNQRQQSRSGTIHTALDTRTKEPFQTDIFSSSTFPIYTVGPATSRTLSGLINPSVPLQPKPSTPLLSLNPTLHGSDTGNGGTLAKFIQSHYNALHSQTHFTWHDAPRLPFVPLLGMGSENYSRRRLETDDPRLTKKPLLFLVGETRRDIIPKTLMGTTSGNDDDNNGTDLDPNLKIQVDEVEVYSTTILQSFDRNLRETLKKLENGSDGDSEHTPHRQNTNNNDTNTAPPAPPVPTTQPKTKIIAIVIFSPQGTSTLLQNLGLIDETQTLTSKAKTRWQPDNDNDDNNTSSETTSAASSNPDPNTTIETKYIITTIGPTTRDHLVHTFGIHPDAVALKPSPEGVSEAITTFLKEKWGIYA